jgi:type IV secretory pathway TrbD component
LAFEKEKKINILIMAAGAVAAVVGIAVYLYASRLGGVVISLIGLSLLVIGFTIQGVFYKMKMMEILSNNKRTNGK